jgi:hypothetical protein
MIFSLLGAFISQAKEPSMQEETTRTAKGAFEGKLQPLTQDGLTDDAKLGRMSIDKTFTGDLTGTSKGMMLTAMTDVKGSAGYVAVEKVEGTLHGKQGAFVLQHSGTMSAAGQSLTITVVPDSGTGELKGISGTFEIIIEENGDHFYVFEYVLN